MRVLRIFVTAAVIAAVSSTAIGQPASPCVTRQQVASLLTVLTPTVLAGARQRCGSYLAPTAYLRSAASGSQLQRFQADAAASKAQGMAAFRLIAGDDTPKGISDATFMAAVQEIMTADLFDDIDAAKCGALNEMFDATQTLSGEQVGRFLGNAFALTIGGQKKGRDPQICKV